MPKHALLTFLQSYVAVFDETPKYPASFPLYQVPWACFPDGVFTTMKVSEGEAFVFISNQREITVLHRAPRDCLIPLGSRCSNVDALFIKKDHNTFDVALLESDGTAPIVQSFIFPFTSVQDFSIVRPTKQSAVIYGFYRPPEGLTVCMSRFNINMRRMDPVKTVLFPGNPKCVPSIEAWLWSPATSRFIGIPDLDNSIIHIWDTVSNNFYDFPCPNASITNRTTCFCVLETILLIFDETQSRVVAYDLFSQEVLFEDNGVSEFSHQNFHHQSMRVKYHDEPGAVCISLTESFENIDDPTAVNVLQLTSDD